VVRQVIVVLQTDEDLAISRELAHSLGLDPKFFFDDDLDPDQLSNVYGACRMVISSRLHAVLLSMLAGVPAISLAPEVTFQGTRVLELLGLESLWIPSTTAPDRAVEQCLEIAYADESHRRAVVSAVSAARAQWDGAPQRLQEVIQEARRLSIGSCTPRQSSDPEPRDTATLISRDPSVFSSYPPRRSQTTNHESGSVEHAARGIAVCRSHPPPRVGCDCVSAAGSGRTTCRRWRSVLALDAFVRLAVRT